MARLKGPPGPGKSLAIKTGLNIYANRGALVAAKWPRKRGRPRSPVTREQNEWFRQANLLAKYADGQSQWMAIEVSKGSPWYPRDLLLSAMAGRLFETLTIDGVEFRSVAIRDDVSSDLDFLAGKVTGTIIVRGEDLWSALIPGDPFEVLTSHGPGVLPSYELSGSGISLVRAATIPVKTVSATARATKGVLFRAREDFTVFRLGTQLDATINQEYRGAVYELDAAFKITAILAETADFLVPATGQLTLDEALTAPAVLSGDKDYVLAWTRREATDTNSVPMLVGWNTIPFIGLPVKYLKPLNGVSLGAQLAKKAPAIGDTFIVAVAETFYMTATISV